MITRELQSSQEAGEKGENVVGLQLLSAVAVGHEVGLAGPLFNTLDDFSK